MIDCIVYLLNWTALRVFAALLQALGAFDRDFLYYLMYTSDVDCFWGFWSFVASLSSVQ